MPTLSIDIEARFAKFQDGLDKIDRDVSRATRNMSKSFGTLKTVAASLIGTFAGLAGIQVFKSLIDDLDKLHTVSTRTGVSAEKLVGLALAAKQTGTDFETAAKGLNKINVALSNLATGKSAELKDLLTQLGLPEFAKGAIDAEEAMLQLAGVFPRLSSADQARVALDLLGKSGQELIPLFEGGRKPLEAFFRVGRDNASGINELAKAADEFNDAMTTLAFGLKAALLPVLQALLSAFKGLTEVIFQAKQAGTGFYEILPFEKSRAQISLLRKDLDGLRKQQAEFEAGKATGKGFVGTLNKAFSGSIGDVSQIIPIKERQLAELEKRVQQRENDEARDAQVKASPLTLRPAAVKAKAGRAARVDRDDSAQRLLDQQLRAFERSIDQERDLAQTRNDFLQRFYDDGLISLGDYTKGRIAIMEESANAQKVAIGSEIALLEASKKGKKADDRIAIDTKINDLLDKQATLTRDVAIAGQNLYLDNIQAGKEYADVLQRIHIRALEAKGDAEGAARLSFSLENRDDLAKIDVGLKSASTSPQDRGMLERAKEELNAMRDLNIEVVRFNQVMDDTTRIRNDAADAEERINIAIQEGQTGEIQGLQQIKLLRENLSTQLTEQGEKLENIALLTKDPGQLEHVKSLGMEIERLNSQLDPLLDKFEEMATDGLGGFFEKVASGTVSAKDAFKSMIADWTAEITRFMVRAAVKQLIAGFASSMAGGAGGGGSAGIAAQLYAEGGQVSGPGTGDSIPALLTNKEFVVRAKPTQEPGALAFLTRFNKHGMKSLQRYSMGGQVGRMGLATGGVAMAGGGMTLVQNFTVEPRMPKETQQQLASAAYSGGMRAYRRNK